MRDISDILIKWYTLHKRDLPWRLTRNPYHIWLSEVILQQTRVQQGLSYYLRFVEAFPTVVHLAQASEQDVLKLWQGLGYYSRARNLHQAAKTVAEVYGARFPADYKQIRDLKGVGDYTAAAIASFAYDLPHAVLDGNVFRVLSRLFNIPTPIDSTRGKKEFAALAAELLPVNGAATHNQAIMELGALVCTPKRTDCAQCPLQGKCKANALKTVSLLPVKEGKTKTRDRFFNYLFAHDAHQTVLRIRSGKGIWQNLYEFPLIETPAPLNIDELTTTPEWGQLFGGHELAVRAVAAIPVHKLSHQHIYCQVIAVKVSPLCLAGFRDWGAELVTLGSMGSYPMSRLMELCIKKLEV